MCARSTIGAFVAILSLPSLVRAAEPPKVVVLYRTSGLSDRASAKLLPALAKSKPVTEWRAERLRPGESLEGAIDRLYDYYRREQLGAMPETTRALLDLVRSANPGLTIRRDRETVVRLPVLPMRGLARYELDPGIRIYDTDKRWYSVQRRIPRAEAVVGDAAPPPPPPPPVAVSDAAAVQPADIRRVGTTTAVVAYGTTELLEAAASAADEAIVLPNVSRPGFTRVELLQDGTCHPIEPWLDSPYRDLALSRLQRLRDPAFSTAGKPPLVLVDLDFTGLGHGAKVSSVVQSVLKLADLEDQLNDSILRIDLLVRDEAGAHALNEILARFVNAGQVHPALLDCVADARRWIEEEREAGGIGSAEVPVLLLQAALWDALQSSPFVNLSFRFADPAFSIVRPVLRNNAQPVFVTVAAGNEATVMPTTWAPQDAASTMSGFINVTHGSAAGNIEGSRSNPGSPLRVVSLLAPGCGFEHGAVKATDNGSSLAAPYVAAASWLRHLLDNIPPGEMRKELLASARLLPAGVPESLEAGAFDIWRFLAAVGPHGVGVDGSVVPLVNPRLEFTGQCGILPSGTLNLAPSAGHRRDVLLLREDGAFRLVVRTVPGQGTFALSYACTVSALRLESEGNPLGANSPEEFIASIRYLTM